MDDPNSKPLRDRLDELLRRAREISAEIERRVESVTSDSRPAGEPDGSNVPDAAQRAASAEAAQHAMAVAARAAAVTSEAATVAAEAAAVTSEAVAQIVTETALSSGPTPSEEPTTVAPETAVALAAESAAAAPAAGPATEPAAASSTAAAPPGPPPPAEDVDGK